MLPTVYASNMKVLSRREPSITAIIDQFSHVCLYRYNGQKWEKHGYEGSMFIYEKCVQLQPGAFPVPQTPEQVNISDIWLLHSQPDGHGRLCPPDLPRG